MSNNAINIKFTLAGINLALKILAKSTLPAEEGAWPLMKDMEDQAKAELERLNAKPDQES